MSLLSIPAPLTALPSFQLPALWNCRVGVARPSSQARCSYRPSLTGDRRQAVGQWHWREEEEKRSRRKSSCRSSSRGWRLYPLWWRKNKQPPNKQALTQPQSLLHGCILFLRLWVSLEPLFFCDSRKYCKGLVKPINFSGRTDQACLWCGCFLI